MPILQTSRTCRAARRNLAQIPIPAQPVRRVSGQPVQAGHDVAHHQARGPAVRGGTPQRSGSIADRSSGTITLKFERLGADRFGFTIRDNGCGLPDEYDPAGSKGLGTRIVQGLAAQLGGELSIKSHKDQGTAFQLAFTPKTVPRCT
jgi:hypothetical protein